MKTSPIYFEPDENLGEITVTIAPSKRFRFRLWLAVVLVRLAGRLAYCDVAVDTGLVQCEGCRVSLEPEDTKHDCDGVALCESCYRELAETVGGES